MKRKERRNIYTLLILPLIMSLTACGNPGNGQTVKQQETSSHEKTEIVCYRLKSNSYMDELAEMFNLQSQTTYVKMVSLEDDDYDNEVLAMLENQDDIDIIWIRQPSRSNYLSGVGLLYDLSDMVEHSLLDISCYGQSLDIVQMDDKIYSLPFVQNLWLIFYNQDIFDALSIDYPKQISWEEYAVLAKRLYGQTDDGKTRWGGYIPAWVNNLGAIELGEYLYADELPATEEHLRLRNRLYNEDKSHPSLLEMENVFPTGYEAFLDGEVSMMINGDWAIQIMRRLEKERVHSCHWGVSPLPSMNGAGAGTSVGSNSYLGIASSCASPQNAFEFIEFCCGAQGASILASQSCCPSYFTEASREIYVRDAGLGEMDFLFDTIIQNEEGKYPYYKELRDLFDEESTKYLNGEKTLDEMMEDYMKRRRKLVI